MSNKVLKAIKIALLVMCCACSRNYNSLHHHYHSNENRVDITRNRLELYRNSYVGVDSDFKRQKRHRYQ